jgi:hypothetical protein
MRMMAMQLGIEEGFRADWEGCDVEEQYDSCNRCGILKKVDNDPLCHQWRNDDIYSQDSRKFPWDPRRGPGIFFRH